MDNEIAELGDRLAKLSKTEAQALRWYLIEEYELLPGCIEGLVWSKAETKKYWLEDGIISEAFHEFCSQFVVRAG